MAETSSEIQIWSNLIKSLAGLTLPPLRMEPAYVTVSPGLRHALMGITNNNRETIVHLLAKQVFSFAGKEKKEGENLSAIAWAKSNGCSVTENR